MQIHFYCPRCNLAIAVDDSLSGRRGKCPKCELVLSIPTVAHSIPIAASRPAISISEPRSQAASRTMSGYLVVGSIATVVVLVGISVGFFIANLVSSTDSFSKTPKVSRAVQAYLERSERNVRILRTYPEEAVRGCSFLAETRVAILWERFDGAVRYFPVEIAPGYEAGEIESPIEQTVDLSACFAVRIQFETDEGFGRRRIRDRVFIVTPDLVIACSLPVAGFRIGKPGDAPTTAVQDSAKTVEGLLNSSP